MGIIGIIEVRFLLSFLIAVANLTINDIPAGANECTDGMICKNIFFFFYE